MSTEPKPVTATLDGVHLTDRAALRDALAAHKRGDGKLVLWSLAESDHGREVDELPAAGVEVQAPQIGEAGTAEMATVAVVVEGVRGWKLA